MFQNKHLPRAGELPCLLEMARACPFFDTGGTLEVAEMMEMN
jgi:hypothetical protein